MVKSKKSIINYRKYIKIAGFISQIVGFLLWLLVGTAGVDALLTDNALGFFFVGVGFLFSYISDKKMIDALISIVAFAYVAVRAFLLRY